MRTHTVDAETEFQEKVRDYRQMEWTRRKWRRQPGLVEKNRRSIAFYFGQEYDKDKYDLVDDAWGHDHCKLCFKTISDFTRDEGK